MTTDHLDQRLARAATDEEVEHYKEKGWAKLDGLISAELAAELLAGAKDIIETETEAGTYATWSATGGETKDRYEAAGGVGGKVINIGNFQDYHFPGRDDKREPFRSLAFSRDMGSLAQQFIDRDVPIQFSTDMIACKMPVGSAGSDATRWHQDLPTLPFDRVGSMNIWVALDEVTPDRGALQFLSGSFREGPLGNEISDGEGKSPLEVFSRQLAKYEMSPPLHLKPGDATVHNANTVHGAPQNTTDKPRWAYILAYFPADTRYTGATNHNFNDIGLEPLQVIRHERFPIIYP